MKKIFLLFFLLFIVGINCHIKVVANLIKSEDFKLKGTFTINSANAKNKYLSIHKNYILFSKNRHNYDIIESSNNSYYIISRYHQKFLGIKQKNGKQCKLYDKIDNTNSKYISWDLIKQDSHLTKSGYVYMIKNNYNNKYMYYNPKNKYPKLDLLPKDSSIANFQFRILKLYSEEENIKQSNYDIVEKEPVDVFIKYIDLMPNDKVRFLKPYDEIKDKIVYVKDKDLLGYDTANIFAFSFNLHKMEKFNISKNFIYFEDDFFIGRELKKTDFFYYDEKEKKVFPFVINNYIREINYNQRMSMYNYLYKKRKKIKAHGRAGWMLSILATDKYFSEKYDMNIILPAITHCAYPVNIDDLKVMYDAIQGYKYINETLHSTVRHVLTLNQPEFHNVYQLNINKRKVHKIRSLYIDMENSKMSQLYYPLFVLNTCGNNIPTKAEYQHHKAIMRKRFPNPTKYEIGEEINYEININDDELKDDNINRNNNEAIEAEENDNGDEIEAMRRENFGNNEEAEFDFEDNKYNIHGYVLLGVLLGVILFIKYINSNDVEYN